MLRHCPPSPIATGLNFLFRTAFICLSLFGLSQTAGAVDPEPGSYIAHFRDRQIDLEPFLLGYPYGDARADLDQGHFLYFKTTPTGKWLRAFELQGGEQIDLAQGRQIGKIDWSRRSWWGQKYHPPTNRLYINADERNDEQMNIYAMDLTDGSLEQVTDNDYTYGYGFSSDYHYLAYISRSGRREPFNSCLHVRNMETGQDRIIICDEGGRDRFTWSHIAFTADNESIIVELQHDGDRRLNSLALINLDEPEFDYLTPPRWRTFKMGLVREWLRDDEFLYTSAESGFSNLYRYDLTTRQSTQITFYDEDIREIRLLAAGSPTALLVLRRPDNSVIQLLDCSSGDVIYEEVVEAKARLIEVNGNWAIFSMTHLLSPLELVWRQFQLEATPVTSSAYPLAEMPELVKKKLIHCRAEKVSYPTFDQTDDGSRRQLHAFYLEPLNPPKRPQDRLVLITAFYGGDNNYDKKNHILGAAGIATFSPAVRGVGGFGAAFSALNDGDLGGDEIVDVFYAAKWLMEEKGYSARQIGVHGGSHGGYAAMRSLTFPPETNNRNESFDFGFGISHAGFSDIISFYESCNIPDWVLLEAGDPVNERDKLLDRSPLSHVELLRAPIMLSHGRNDWRVPVTESRRFVEKARELGKQVTYIEFEGQGHGIGGVDNLIRFYQAQFDFLDSLDR